MFQRISVSTAIGLSLLVGTSSGYAHTPAESGATQLGGVEVTATEIFRNRLSTPAPVLSYDFRYFQRFEPMTVGDMLKRIPGVSFSSDVLEYDYVQLRGIGAEYTQILINGRRLPGSAGNRAIQVDRIPAEMVERIELIRSPTAATGSQGVAGTLNIILKKGATYAGGGWRLGLQHFENGKARGSGFASIGGTHENVSFSLALDVQQRYNPKRKEEFHYTPSRELAFNEYETDTRDGTDASLSGGMNVYLDDGGQWSLNAYYLDTDRDETEHTYRIVTDPNAYGELEGSATHDKQITERGYQHESISQQTFSIDTSLDQPLGENHDLTLALSYSGYRGDTTKPEWERAYADEDIDDGEIANPDLDEIEDTRETIDTRDDSLLLTAKMKSRAAAHELVYGVELGYRTRDFTNLFLTRKYADGQTAPAFEISADQVGDGRFKLTEKRVDAYIDDTWTLTDKASLEYGLRMQYTRTAAELRHVASSDMQWNPSAHYRYRLTDDDVMRFSVARTVRRPDFEDLTPYNDVNEDSVVRGNQNLQPETAWGLDVGFEHRLAGPGGIIGLNAFYRRIQDKIELAQIGKAIGSDGDVVPLLQPTNFGHATVYGLEFDSNFPLTFIGQPDMAVFGNVTWLHSKLTDPTSGRTRAFNNQPDLIYNIGFNQRIDAWGASWGLSYQKRAESWQIHPSERVLLDYEGNLEAYIEKRFDNGMTLRLAGNNLLDAVKTEDIANLDDGHVEEYETQLEHAGAVVMLTLRGKF